MVLFRSLVAETFRLREIFSRVKARGYLNPILSHLISRYLQPLGCVR